MLPYSPLKVLKGGANTPSRAHRNMAAYRAVKRAGRHAETLTKFLCFLAEDICVETKQGTPFSELDLILRCQQTILILEVNYRRHLDSTESGIPSAQQIEKMRKAVTWMMEPHYAFEKKQIHLHLVQLSG